MAKKKSFPDLNKDGKITKADNAIDEVGNPKGKKIVAQLTGFGKARH